ncbi:P-loop containing nucleoside triphosphate hydrolase protein [Amylostereum chailletii]|nr:P-loop containing nucleoside triphosphate hydrolase protein [Amylostereum chailletii]
MSNQGTSNGARISSQRPRTPSPTPKGCRHKQPSTPSRATPRTRKTPLSARLRGIKQQKMTRDELRAKLSKRLGLTFEVDDWQAEMILKIQSGYDSVLVAGTGYGKSIIFEGLAALNKSKTIVVISPLKALERDQVEEAKKKGLSAKMINEDTVKDDRSLFGRIRRGQDQLYYVSPEMALSESFVALWQDTSFRGRVQAIIVDEAHCIAQWGDDFREHYKELGRLRNYVGHDIPFLACTATCSTAIFNVIWKTLDFGNRPFWGLDVGADRANLAYITRKLKNPRNPVLDVLNILPAKIPSDAPIDILPKCLFYFDEVPACGDAVETLRKCLPGHLRGAVQTFKSPTSEPGKALTWDEFRAGRCRILCATDAAGMGCNVPDVQYVVCFKVTQSLAVLAQRWGRAGRRRDIEGTCILLVPNWVFRPHPLPPHLATTRTGRPRVLEPKSHTQRREKLGKEQEEFLNLGFDESNRGCAHTYLSTQFRPITLLPTYTCLDHAGQRPAAGGKRADRSQFDLRWTRLDLNRHPPRSRCCNWCSPSLSDLIQPPPNDDPRLSAYMDEFIIPLDPAMAPNVGSLNMDSEQRSRSSSLASSISSVEPIAPFIPLTSKATIPEAERSRLEDMIERWRESRHAARAPQVSFTSRRLDMPNKAVNSLLNHAANYMQAPEIDVNLLRKYTAKT